MCMQSNTFIGSFFTKEIKGCIHVVTLFDFAMDAIPYVGCSKLVTTLHYPLQAAHSLVAKVVYKL